MEVSLSHWQGKEKEQNRCTNILHNYFLYLSQLIIIDMILRKDSSPFSDSTTSVLMSAH